MKLTEHEILKRLKAYEDWAYEDGGLNVSFRFESFKDAFTVMTRIAFEAERLQHHPDWCNAYNQLNIHLTTHEVGGVTEKDFELAHIINDIVS